MGVDLLESPGVYLHSDEDLKGWLHDIRAQL